jgi:hypothetical protein
MQEERLDSDWQTEYILGHFWERIGDTKGVMKSLKSKDKQYNNQKKKDKRTMIY